MYWINNNCLANPSLFAQQSRYLVAANANNQQRDEDAAAAPRPRPSEFLPDRWRTPLYRLVYSQEMTHHHATLQDKVRVPWNVDSP